MSLRSWGFKSPLAHHPPGTGGPRGGFLRRRDQPRAGRCWRPALRSLVPSPTLDRRRTRIQRLVILALILFIVVFGLAWWARSCQHNRKVGTYETYFDGRLHGHRRLGGLGKQVSAIMLDPTKLSRKELIDKLGQLSAQQEEIAVRAGRLEPPGTLEDEQTVFSTGMKVRANGFSLLRTAMLGALANKKVGVKAITALDGYFSGPDAYYQELVYLPARETMDDDGVTGVAVPTSTYYLTWKALDTTTVTATLDNVGKSPKLTGIHGVALLDVTAKSSSGDVTLVKGRTNDVPASATSPSSCRSQNQGSVTENKVPVTATLTLPGGDPDQAGGLHRHHRGRQDAGRHHHGVRHPDGGAEQGGHAQGRRRTGARASASRPTTPPRTSSSCSSSSDGCRPSATSPRTWLWGARSSRSSSSSWWSCS